MKIKPFSYSNIFIFLSFIWTLFYIIFWIPDFLYFNTSLWVNFIKFFLYTFFHGWFLHFLWNSIIIAYIWNILENKIWKRKYLLLFIFSVIFSWFSILYFSDLWIYNVIWISGFCMAILSYYTFDLFYKNNPEYKWWLYFIILNILIWLTPWISFLWHLFWAIAWVIFYFLNKEFLKKKMVWLFSN